MLYIKHLIKFERENLSGAETPKMGVSVKREMAPESDSQFIPRLDQKIILVEIRRRDLFPEINVNMARSKNFRRIKSPVGRL